MTNSMSCSTTRMPRPSARSWLSSIGERALFEVAQAGGGFVEQQHRGLAGQRARDFHHALLTQRERRGRRVGMRAEAAAFDLAAGLGHQRGFFGAV
jgi:hypothetical protein